MHQSAYDRTTANTLQTHADTIMSATNAMAGIKRKTAEPTTPLKAPGNLMTRDGKDYAGPEDFSGPIMILASHLLPLLLKPLIQFLMSLYLSCCHQFQMKLSQKTAIYSKL